MLAKKCVKAGYRIIVNNRLGPGSLADYVYHLGPMAAEGTVAESAKAAIIFLAARWANVENALKGISAWDGRIVVDTNPILADGTYVDLRERTSTKIIAAQLPEARVGSKSL